MPHGALRVFVMGERGAKLEAATVDEARPQILRTICETLDWDMGAVWDVDTGNEVMHCVDQTDFRPRNVRIYVEDYAI